MHHYARVQIVASQVFWTDEHREFMEDLSEISGNLMLETTPVGLCNPATTQRGLFKARRTKSSRSGLRRRVPSPDEDASVPYHHIQSKVSSDLKRIRGSPESGKRKRKWVSVASRGDASDELMADSRSTTLQSATNGAGGEADVATAGSNRSTPVTNTSKASSRALRGWWVCNECRNLNLYALSPERCSTCGHYRCQLCRNC